MHESPTGRFYDVDLREVWPHEAADFTKWLRHNLDLLGAAVGIDLEFVAGEASLGPFSLDLLARTAGSQETVIIENQLEQTDHRHLGQLMTYAAGFDASHVIWISKHFREKHRFALDWLNNNTSPNRNFFGVQVSTVKIDSSKPAPLFRLVVSPNAWQKAQSQAARAAAASPDQENLAATFAAIYEIAKQSARFVQLLKPLPNLSYYVIERTHRRIEYSVAFSRNKLRVEVIFNFASSAMNARLFYFLREHSREIDAAAGAPVEWDFAEARVRQAIRLGRRIDRERLLDQIDEIAEWSCAHILALRAVIEPQLTERALTELERDAADSELEEMSAEEMSADDS